MSATAVTSPPRRDENAILEPSGDQSGNTSNPRPVVSRVTAFVATSARYSWSTVSRCETNTSRAPSGDQFGEKSDAGWSVTRIGFEPAVSTT